ncbi:hypothetical protein EVAR_102615_1 [Eumeta japonica]|uniref:Uncharacterized protein n=1 Tax=Eumeta variegata TaxID=151549 RepID=A0A4C1TUS5_EUMVA|nr:hypothetical protein EVAR_102615_1 [Eumeta japonica]
MNNTCLGVRYLSILWNQYSIIWIEIRSGEADSRVSARASSARRWSGAVRRLRTTVAINGIFHNVRNRRLRALSEARNETGIELGIVRFEGDLSIAYPAPLAGSCVTAERSCSRPFDQRFMMKADGREAPNTFDTRRFFWDDVSPSSTLIIKLNVL